VAELAGCGRLGLHDRKLDAHEALILMRDVLEELTVDSQSEVGDGI
jgi:hypothetical protein